MDEQPKIENTIASLGGKASAAKLTPEERKERARMAAEIRWGILKATHESEDHPLVIGGMVIPCAVLESGVRVLSRTGFMKAIGRTGKAKGGRLYDEESKLPVFLTAKNLKPFLTKEIAENSTPIPYRPLAGGRAIGYKAELLPQVCNVFLEADDAGALLSSQVHILEKCKILIRGLATVGIIALVDEATGYQEVRDRQALQAILDKFLRREFAAWAKRFPDEFYREMFRLRGWTWRGMKVNRPQCVATYTKDVIYRRLAPGILTELEQRNPVQENGRRKTKHHQWFTDDIGHPALGQHLHAVIGLMRATPDNDWPFFIRLLDRAFPKRGESVQLDIFDAGVPLTLED